MKLNPGDDIRGLVLRTREVTCARCETFCCGRIQPRENLRAEGWRQVGGRWVCGDCRAAARREGGG